MLPSEGLFCSGGSISKSEAIGIFPLPALFLLEVTSSKRSLGDFFLQPAVAAQAEASLLGGLCLFSFLRWCCIPWSGGAVVNGERVR